MHKNDTEFKFQHLWKKFYLYTASLISLFISGMLGTSLA